MFEELGNNSSLSDHVDRRNTFYGVRLTFQVGETATLIENRRGPQNPHPSRLAIEIKQKIEVTPVSTGHSCCRFK